MSYGQNQPWGLQATRSLGASTWNGQTNPYLIKSGYPNNIFRGDPVIVAGTADAAGLAGAPYTGYIISIYDAVGGNVFNNQATVGIFNGCSYTSLTTTNPIDPASPGKSFWPSGMNTLNAVAAIAYVIDDPNTVFNVQTTLAGPVGADNTMVGATFAYGFSLIGTQVQGNTNTGVSSVSVTGNPVRGAGTGTANTICVGLVSSPPNAGQGIAYNNIEVLIQNHQYAQRAIARN